MNPSKNRPTTLFVSLVASFLATSLDAHAERNAPAPAFTAAATIAKPLATRHLPDEVATGQARFNNYLDETRTLKFAVSLPVRNPQDLDKLFAEVSDPRSANYRKYLSSEQFNDRFAPKQADYDAVVAWAKASGFTVRAGSTNRRVVALEGNVGAVNRAFNVNMSEFQHPRENRSYFSPDREPTAHGLGVTLLHVTGLQNFVLPVRHLQKPRSANISKTQVGSGPSGSFTPTDMRTGVLRQRLADRRRAGGGRVLVRRLPDQRPHPVLLVAELEPDSARQQRAGQRLQRRVHVDDVFRRHVQDLRRRRADPGHRQRDRHGAGS